MGVVSPGGPKRIPGSQLLVAGGELTLPIVRETMRSGKQSLVAWACAGSAWATGRSSSRRKRRSALKRYRRRARPKLARADRAMTTSLEVAHSRGQVSWLAAVYSPALPRRLTLPVGFSGFRYRSQLRGSGGLAPPSLFNRPRSMRTIAHDAKDQESKAPLIYAAALCLSISPRVLSGMPYT